MKLEENKISIAHIFILWIGELVHFHEQTTMLLNKAEYTWKVENNEAWKVQEKLSFFQKMDDTLHSTNSHPDFLLE